MAMNFQRPARPMAPRPGVVMSQMQRPQPAPSPYGAATPYGHAMPTGGGGAQGYGGNFGGMLGGMSNKLAAPRPNFMMPGGSMGGALGSLMGGRPMGGTPMAPGMTPFSQAMAGRGLPQMQSRFAGSTMDMTGGAGAGPQALPQPQSSPMSPMTMGRGASPMGGGNQGYSPMGGGGGLHAGMGGGNAGGDYGGGVDQYGQSLDPQGKKKFKGAGALRKLFKKGLPWQQNQQNYETIQQTIADILGRRGQISPEALIREQADVEQGRQGAQQGLQARLAQAGIDPGSPMAMSMGGTLDQASNRLGVEGRRTLDLQAEDRMRNDLNLMIPYLQAMMPLLSKHAGGGVQAVPTGGGGGGAGQYAQPIADIAGAMINKWG